MEETVYEPFEFFKLPYDLQRKIILEDLDSDSIENLCEAANNSTLGIAREFYFNFCKNSEIWREKIKIDFYRDFPEEFEKYDRDRNSFTPKLYKSFHNAKHLTRKQLVDLADFEALKILGFLREDNIGVLIEDSGGLGSYI